MKFRPRDILPYILIFLSILIGIISDILTLNGIHILTIPDLRDICKTILSIQATIAVLSISILTVVGSFLDKSYLGISISDFYYNQKNPFFKSNAVIYSELFILLAGIVSLLYERYNLIFMLFAAAIVIIIYEINNIYRILQGENSVRKDIENHLEEVFSSDNENNKSSYFKIFCRDWEATVFQQSDHEFLYYEELFQKYILLLLKSPKAETVTFVCKRLQSVINLLLTSKNEQHKIYAILLLDNILLKICRSSETFNQVSFNNFSLLSGVVFNLCDAFKSISLEWIQTFDWLSLLSKSDYLAITFNLNSKYLELDASNRIATVMGTL